MTHIYSQEGALSEAQCDKMHAIWLQAAQANGIDLSGFNPRAPRTSRLAWAARLALTVGMIYARFSTKMQHSTEDQIRECLIWAARNGVYVLPESICVDEAEKGKRDRRKGLKRAKQILESGLVSTFLVYKASRLFRHPYKGFELIQEEVVEAGMRAVSVSQGIDTADKKAWKMQLQIHGIMDEMLLEAIADHVRAGLTGLFLAGWTTGALGVGYRPRILPDAPLTNRGLPRTAPEVDPEAAELIREHALLLLDGMPLNEGLRRWRAVGGPCDPRASTGQMNYVPYRTLFSNIRLTGWWEFGRRKNDFSSKLDYTRQIVQPDSEVTRYQCEELRILDDDLFVALQRKLLQRKHGPRGPRKDKSKKLWDLTTGMFFCAACSEPDDHVRFYQVGAGGGGMQCKHGDQCPCKSAVRREEAVRAVCKELAAAIRRDTDLIERVICQATKIDEEVAERLDQEVQRRQRQVQSITKKIDGLYDLLGEVDKNEHKELKAKIKAVQFERAQTQDEVLQLQKQLEKASSTLTPQGIRDVLSNTEELLISAGSGQLSEDGVYKALSIFEKLTGGQIMVHVERRAGRKRTSVRGVFRLQFVDVFPELPLAGQDLPLSDEVTVWLRKPPRLDLIAERVHQLIDVEGMSHRETAKQLQREGQNVNAGNVWYSYHRWYEMQGLEPPKVPYNNGKKRRSR
ncbi:recombinase family protein [Bremerella alba]|uniref:Resolvase/invertase-type recombinase catalytic domain-containing protein n=1 Tax=Bremerella alba TaxID=980252 RepID=A0A7V9A771_9BACT|nr:recombinase family protein [Bremerella alba]MBA2115022.1 hypothetical protein [Bremerella alba]